MSRRIPLARCICGGHGQVGWLISDSSWWVHCSICSVSTGEHGSERMARKAWNALQKRKQQAGEAEREC